jgi:hypothetical protein
MQGSLDSARASQPSLWLQGMNEGKPETCPCLRELWADALLQAVAGSPLMLQLMPAVLRP